jgi:hypothetical protein
MSLNCFLVWSAWFLLTSLFCISRFIDKNSAHMFSTYFIYSTLLRILYDSFNVLLWFTLVNFKDFLIHVLVTPITLEDLHRFWYKVIHDISAWSVTRSLPIQNGFWNCKAFLHLMCLTGQWIGPSCSLYLQTGTLSMRGAGVEVAISVFWRSLVAKTALPS